MGRIQGNLASGAYGVGWLLLGATEAVEEDKDRRWLITN